MTIPSRDFFGGKVVAASVGADAGPLEATATSDGFASAPAELSPLFHPPLASSRTSTSTLER